MENAETKNTPRINLDARPGITKITIAIRVIGPYGRVMHQEGYTDMENVISDLKSREEIARKLQEAISDIFFFKNQPIDKILNKHFPEDPARVMPKGEKKRYYINKYITIHEELK